MNIINLHETRQQDERFIIGLASNIERYFTENNMDPNPELLSRGAIIDFIDDLPAIVEDMRDEEILSSVYDWHLAFIAASGGKVSGPMPVFPRPEDARHHTQALEWARNFIASIKRDFGVSLPRRPRQ